MQEIDALDALVAISSKEETVGEWDTEEPSYLAPGIAPPSSQLARKLKLVFSAAAEGLSSRIDIDELVAKCEINLFDGASEHDLRKAMVFTARAMVERDPEYSKLAARLALTSIYEEVIGEDLDPKRINEQLRKAFIANTKHCVEQGRFDKRLLDYDLELLANKLDFTRDRLFEYLGLQMLYDRYLVREEGGERRYEAPQFFWMRVAMGTAMNEAPEEKEQIAIEFYNLMSQLYYVPSTPTLFNAGTSFPQLSSCYLNTIKDDLEHIFKVYGDNAQLSKYSGGIGTDYTNLRGTGALIKTTNVGSQGVIPFLAVANMATVAINRSGKRRGAACAYLETWHYDIENFLDLRKNTGDERRRTHDMNTANWIPDLFMKRVAADQEWTLFSPDETPDLHHLYGKAFEQKYEFYEQQAELGKINLFKKVRATSLWRKMLTMLFETGHPWITFKDPFNVRNPQDHAGVIHHTNLCTEIGLNTSENETAVCNLGSVNLPRHIVNKRFDRNMLAHTIRWAMRMLDNVIDLNFYPTQEAKDANLRHRPVGLGVMGVQDVMYELGIDFESEAAVQFSDQNMEYVAYHAIMSSAELAKERGTYTSYKDSKWDRGIFPQDTIDLLEAERGIEIDVKRGGVLDWGPVRLAVQRHGMRNSNTMAIAPTATISNIAGTGPCIEPNYKHLFVKSNMSGEFTIVNKYLVDDLKKRGLWGQDTLDALKHTEGSVQDIPWIPEDLKRRYKVAFEIAPEWLIRIAAHRGKWIDQSQSLNLFMNNTSGQKLSDMYMYAWKMGLKSTYYLRTQGASSIEKSTVSLGTTNKIEAPTLNACSIDNPDCEACQ